MPQTINATQLPVEKIFSDDFILSIPIYQRPYAWKEEQAGDMLDDFLAAINGLTGITEEANPYFLGSIVLINNTLSQKHYDIIDGQQRLTTLSILLAILRHLEPDFGDDITEQIYQKANRAKRTEDLFRLTLREDDMHFFREFIQREGGIERLLPPLENNEQGRTLTEVNPEELPESQQRIYCNAKYLRERLIKVSIEKRQLLVQLIATHCLMVVITASDRESAYRIFSVLNNRGLELSHADIFKAEILGAINSIQDQQIYSRSWDNFEKMLGREHFQNLFAHIRMIYRPQKLRGTILSEFYQYVEPKTNPKSFVDNILRPFAEALDTVIRANYDTDAYHTEVNERLEMLNEIDDSDWIPPAIYYLAKKRGNAEALQKFFADLERLAAYLTLVRSTVNERIERYGKVLILLRSIFEPATEEQRKNEVSLYDVDSPLQLTSEECLEMLKVLDSDLYLHPDCLYTLLRLNYEFSDERNFVRHKSTTIEHVLPQNPPSGSEWIQWYPDESHRKGWVHRIGNLVPLSGRKNSNASNRPFMEKVNSYFLNRNQTSSYPLTTQVIAQAIDSPIWTPDVLERRQQLCLQKLTEAWRLKS